MFHFEANPTLSLPRLRHASRPAAFLKGRPFEAKGRRTPDMALLEDDPPSDCVTLAKSLKCFPYFVIREMCLVPGVV